MLSVPSWSPLLGAILSLAIVHSCIVASQDTSDSVLAADWLPSRQDTNLASLSQTSVLDTGTSNIDRGDTFDRGPVANSDYHRSTCQLVKIVHLLGKANCQPKAIASYACSGSCTSNVQVSRLRAYRGAFGFGLVLVAQLEQPTLKATRFRSFAAAPAASTIYCSNLEWPIN